MILESELLEKTVTIRNQLGLHARVATALVQTMKRHTCQVTLAKDGMEVDARSVLGLLLLAASPGAELIIRAQGPGSLEAVEQISKLLENDDSDHVG